MYNSKNTKQQNLKKLTFITSLSSFKMDCSYNSCNSCKVKVIKAFFIARSELRVERFLFEHGVLQCHTNCSKCGSVLKLCKRGFRCQKKGSETTPHCRFTVTRFKGTFFDRAKISFKQVFLFVTIYFFGAKPKLNYLAHEVGISSATAVDWCNFIRQVFYADCEHMSQPIGGPGKIIELNEVAISKKKQEKGRTKWIFSGMQRGDKTKFFVIPLTKWEPDTLVSIIEKYVLPGTEVVSEGWNGMAYLTEDDLKHLREDLSLNFVDRQSSNHSQNFCWRNLKKQIPGSGRIPAHYGGYLAELFFKRRYPDYRDRIHAFWKSTARLYPGIPHPEK